MGVSSSLFSLLLKVPEELVVSTLCELHSVVKAKANKMKSVNILMKI
jgi:hypothetical protein